MKKFAVDVTYHLQYIYLHHAESVFLMNIHILIVFGILCTVCRN